MDQFFLRVSIYGENIGNKLGLFVEYIGNIIEKYY